MGSVIFLQNFFFKFQTENQSEIFRIHGILFRIADVLRTNYPKIIPAICFEMWTKWSWINQIKYVEDSLQTF